MRKYCTRCHKIVSTIAKSAPDIAVCELCGSPVHYLNDDGTERLCPSLEEIKADIITGATRESG